MSPIAAQLLSQHRAGLRAAPRAPLLERFPSFGLCAAEKMERITNHRLVTALAGGSVLQTTWGSAPLQYYPPQLHQIYRMAKPRRSMIVQTCLMGMSLYLAAAITFGIRVMEVKNVIDCLQG